MAQAFTRFDAADYLNSDADIAAYLEAATEEGDPAALAAALGAVARARNMSQLARDTGLSREGLWEALGPNGNPTLATVMKVAAALGFEVVIRPRAPGSAGSPA